MRLEGAKENVFGGRETKAGMEAAAQKVAMGPDWRPLGGIEGRDWTREAGSLPDPGGGRR